MDIYYYYDIMKIPVPFTAWGFPAFDEEVSDDGKNQDDRRKEGKNMIRLDNEICIIGFDDGYQFGKTANFIYDNGVHFLGSAEPTLKDNSLLYDGEYFKVGEGRTALTEDKLSDDSARLRTMAGIAMELRKEGMCRANVVLTVGLPFSNYGRDKIKLIDYYNRQNVLEFSYEGEDYSAIASRLGNMKGDYLIVDIGAKRRMLSMYRMGFR